MKNLVLSTVKFKLYSVIAFPYINARFFTVNSLDYIENYEGIAFRVNYTFDSENPDHIIFAAQPFEMLEEDDSMNPPSSFLIYGRIEYDSTFHVGFKGLCFVVTEELHQRIGELYKLVRVEFSRRYSYRKEK